jgi:hypothetical protein
LLSPALPGNVFFRLQVGAGAGVYACVYVCEAVTDDVGRLVQAGWIKALHWLQCLKTNRAFILLHEPGNTALRDFKTV